MAGQVDESDDFRAFLAHFTPVKMTVLRTIDHATVAGKAENIIAHWTGAPRLRLVLVSKQALPSQSAAVVQLTVCQHAQQSALTS